MRRRSSLLLAMTLTATCFTVLAEAPPASAIVVCAGTGKAFVTDAAGRGMLFPVASWIQTTGTNHTVLVKIGDNNPVYNFSFGFFPPGGCFHPSPDGTVDTSKGAFFPTIVGTVKGYCGFSTGTGTFPVNGSLFAWVDIGGLGVITGHVVGIATGTANAAKGESCTHNTPAALGPGGGALSFVVNLTVVLLNCNSLPPTTETLVPTLTQIVLTHIAVAGQLVAVHVSSHIGFHTFTNQPCVPDIFLQ